MQIKKDSKNDKHKHTWSRKLTPAQRLAQLNHQFKNLKLEDYVRTYTDLSAKIDFKIPTEEQLQDVFRQMDKTSPEEQKINCSCCGYDTCREMATAIFNGFNTKNNCIHYIKNEIHVFSKRLEEQNRKENTPRAYLGNEYTTYQALQHQRKLERTMRKYRQDIKLLQEGKSDADAITLTKAKYHGKMQEYEAFSRHMSLPLQKDRIYQDGLGRVT